MSVLAAERVEGLNFGGLPPRDTLPTAIGGFNEESKPSLAESQAEQVVLDLLMRERGSLVRVLRADRNRLIEEISSIADLACGQSAKRTEALTEELTGVEKRLVRTIIF